MKQEQANPSDRRAALVAAEKRAETLFDEIERRGLVSAGRTEREVEQDIYAIALQQFGVEKHWHKRIVRAGPNTLTLAADDPPVRNIESDDIVYVDLGRSSRTGKPTSAAPTSWVITPEHRWSKRCRLSSTGSSLTIMRHRI